MLMFQKDKQTLDLVTKMKIKSSAKTINQEIKQIKVISIQQKRVYLQNLTKIYKVIKDQNNLLEILQNKKFNLIQDIIDSLYQLFYKGIQKALSPQILTPDMLTLILMEYYQPFLINQNFKNKKKTPFKMFQQAIISNRLQKYRIQLNPMINNLNYATNVIELYDCILVQWAKIIQQQLQLFKISRQINLVKIATKLMLNQVMPKLQKNIYKIKEMGQISFIRSRIHNFLSKLNNLQALKIQKQGQSTNQQKWQPLPMIIQRMKIFLATKIQEQAQKLTTMKYNIYSLSSYLPIREFLQTIKQCIQYDFEIKNDQNDQTEEVKQISSQNKIKLINLDWQEPFYKLAIGRKPQNHPNNKSLVIFNLNIWYLYLKIIKRKYKTIAVQNMLWCKQKFLQMNIKQCCKIYYDSFDKVLELCGNIPNFRNTLYSQISLLGHQDLRIQISLGIKNKYLTIYKQILKKIGKQSMTNEQVKVFCKQNKINLNKFGKNSNQICIYSVEELSQFIDYS